MNREMRGRSEYLDRPVFIVGHGRSGTSLMLSLLDGHPDLLVFPGEMQPFKITNGPTVDNCLLKTALKNCFQGQHAVAGATEGSVREILRQRLRRAQHPRDVVETLMETYCDVIQADRFRLKHWVEKTAYNYRFIPTLEQWYGGTARYIWLLRDPRDVFNSMRTKNPRFDRRVFAVNWCIFSDLTGVYRRRLDGRFLVVRYEDLVRDTESIMRGVAEFIGVEYLPTLIEPSRNGMPMGYHAKGDVIWWRPKVDTDSIGKRSRHVTEEDLNWLEVRMGRHMRNSGYAPRGDARAFDIPFLFSVAARNILYRMEWYLPVLQRRVWRASAIHLTQRGTKEALERTDIIG
jgi:hypothetical protein